MDEENIIPRIGTFFIVIGVGAISLFVVSDIANVVDFNYFFGGLFALGFGIFVRRNVKGSSSSGRFESWRKMRSGKLKEEKAEKNAKRKEEGAAKSAERKEEKAAKRAQKKEGKAAKK